MELKELRTKAFELASKEYVATCNPIYKEDSPIYIAPTSNVKDMMKLYKDYNSILTVGGTGAIGFEAALNGAKKIDMFDINELQRMFYEMVKSSIMYLDYKDFIKYLTLEIQKVAMHYNQIKNFISGEWYNKIQKHLPDDVNYVFGPLYDYYDNTKLMYSALFRYEHCYQTDYLQKLAAIYNEEEFNKLKNMLNNGDVEINYFTCSLTDLPKKYEGKVDLIVLDNILQYYQNIAGLQKAYDVNMFIDKKLNTLLNEGGRIQACYGFEVSCDAFKKKMNIPYETYGPTSLHKMATDFILDQEIKENIICLLANKWDHYSYDFIPGVETDKVHTADNLILTYTPHK